MIKPRHVAVDGNELVIRGLVRSQRINLRDIRGIKVHKVLSLVDEIGVTIDADKELFFTDAESWFMDLAKALDFDSKFGAGWYRRAESGEVLVYRSSSLAGQAQ